MSVDATTTLVKVVDVQEKTYIGGKYKEVGLRDFSSTCFPTMSALMKL